MQHPAQTLSATNMSFAAIQNSQKQQATRMKNIISFREIQEEEESLQVEADFLKWWTAEEERVKLETLAMDQFDSNMKQQSKMSANKRARLSKYEPNACGKSDHGSVLDAMTGQGSSQSNGKLDKQSDNSKSSSKLRQSQKPSQK